MDELFATISHEKAGLITTSRNNKDGYGQDSVIIPSNSTYSFPEIEGSGYISNIMFTVAPGSLKGSKTMNGWIRELISSRSLWKLIRYKDFTFLKNVIIKIYFDRRSEPDVNVPFANFFGMSFGQYKQYDSIYLGMTSGSFYCRFPMPFKERCRIEVENSDKDGVTLYGEATFHKLDKMPDDWGYFKSYYKKEDLMSNESYVILETYGRGHYVGCNIAMHGQDIFKHLSFLEGDLKIFVDGENKPSMEYTGTEDYFLGGWYFVKGTFSTSDHGCLVKDWLQRKIHAYRFHPEKIPYSSSLKITVDHGELNEVKATYSSVVYWYQI